MNKPYKYLILDSIHLATGGIEFLLGVRTMLYLMGVSGESSVVVFIYRMTDVLVAPFTGLFSLLGIHASSFIDVPALIAAGLYAGISAIILTLIQGLTISTYTDEVERRSVSRNVHARV